MKSGFVAFLLLGFASSPALAQSDQAGTAAADGSAAPTPASEDTNTPDIVVEGEVPDEQRKVCEMQTTTGSIMPRRVCRTVAQIEEEERIARESLEIIKRDRDSRAFTQSSRENR